MKSVLVGNGVNIQFSGRTYTSDFIMRRVKFMGKLGMSDELLDYKMSGDNIVLMLKNFVDIANDIIDNKYEQYADDNVQYALDDFKRRYTRKVKELHEIMLEDWFFLMHMFFLKNKDLSDQADAAKQGFERLILDAIYNEGEIQKLYKNMGKSVRRYFNSFDNIFTLNYDNNIENLTHKKVYHLHGDFSALHASQNEKYVEGYIRTQKNNLSIIKGKEHCFCNALLNYSGMSKLQEADMWHTLNLKSEQFGYLYKNDKKFHDNLEQYKATKPHDYEMIMTKIEHPELIMATEYYFDEFRKIQDELHIIGMSPNNDGHIYKCIEENKDLKKVYIYCFSKVEYDYIKNNMRSDLYEPRWINELWAKLGCLRKMYNCNYNIKKQVEAMREAFNGLSDDDATTDDIVKCVNTIPVYEQKRLCKLVKDNLLERNPTNQSTDLDEFKKTNASVSYIALQEGILPSALYTIYVMNSER